MGHTWWLGHEQMPFARQPNKFKKFWKINGHFLNFERVLEICYHFVHQLVSMAVTFKFF